jgi:hypothetical protein
MALITASLRISRILSYAQNVQIRLLRVVGFRLFSEAEQAH